MFVLTQGTCVATEGRIAMIFDAHTHVGPALAYQNSLFSALKGAELVSIMDLAGIEKACVFAPLWIGGEFFDPEFKEANRVVFQATRDFPDRLIGYGRVNPKVGQAAVDELERCIHDYGFRGLKLHPDTEGYKTNDLEILAPLFDLLDQHRLLSFFHSGYFPTCQPALFAPLAQAFPNVPMILAHIGYRHWMDASILAQQAPNIYLETAGNSAPANIYGAIRVVGADRVLFGTDSPYHEPNYCRNKVEMLPGLTDDERQLVMGGNMSRLLGLTQ